MKINETQRIGVRSVYPINGLTKQPAAVEKDHISISEEAKELLEHKSKRLETLKEQIRNGTYEVESEQLAEKLLKYWKDWM